MLCIKLSKKARIFKNLIAVNLAFLFIFAAVNSSASIQPVLNQTENLGVASQTTSFAIQIIACLVVPTLALKFLGFKWATFIAEVFYLVYIGCLAYPRWFTLIPASIFSGLGNCILWNVIGIYVTLLSKKYAKIKGISFSEAQSFFFGICGCLYLLSYTLGAILVGTILQTENPPTTINDTYDYAGSCGANNCPQTKLAYFQSTPTLSSVYWLCGSLDIVVILSILSTIFLMDDISDDEDDNMDENNPKQRTKFGFKPIINCFKEEFQKLFSIYSSIDVWLLTPITIYTGFELTFIWFELSRAFSTCLGGLSYIGWTNGLFGVLGAFVSFVMGFVLKYIGTNAGIMLMIGTAFAQCIFILSWTPSIEGSYVIFLMVVGLTISESVAATQVRGLYGIYFTNLAAFSAANVSQTTGLFLGSMFSVYFCTNVKTYIFTGLILTSLVCFIILVVKRQIKEQNQINTNESSLQNEVINENESNLEKKSSPNN